MSAGETGYANPHLLIDPETLHARAGSAGPPLLLIDTRPAEQFAAGHIASAVHFDVFGLSLTDTDPAPLRAFLWMIEHLFASRGVETDRAIVVYDEQSGVRAARAFWFLELFGHRDVKLLDGGFTAWTTAGLPVAHDATPPVATEWHGTRRHDVLATWRDVADRIGRDGCVLLDTRTPEEHYGTLVRAARGGTIPGSIHLEWTRNLDASGRFKPASELRRMYEDAGITADRDVITYCQGGYRGAHAYLALRLLGYPRVRTYLGSWREWGDRLELPIEVRPDPRG